MKVGRTCPEHRTFVWNITRDADRPSPCLIFRPPKRRHANAQRRDVDGSVRLPMQTPLAVQPRQSLTPVAKGNESLRSAISPMHNVVPRERNMERCKPFFGSPKRWDVNRRACAPPGLPAGGVHAPIRRRQIASVASSVSTVQQGSVVWASRTNRSQPAYLAGPT